MTANQFRRIALGMSGAVEASHMDHPDFRANGRIFATLDHENVRGMVKPVSYTHLTLPTKA